MRLPIASKAIAPMLWLLASESKDGVFDGSLDELVFRLHITSKEYQDGVKPLIDNDFFILVSGVLAERKQSAIPETEGEQRSLTQDAVFMLALVLILICASFARPTVGSSGIWSAIFAAKWYITGGLLVILAIIIKAWFTKEERINRVESTWGFMKQIFPLLGAGVLVAGFMLGRPGHSALIPEHHIQSFVGGNSFWANLFASLSGALMYFATLTEIPILQGLLGAGMGKGPALALLLAGPALSLPNMLVIGSVMGVKKTSVFCIIIVILSTVSGMLYGWIAG